MLAAFLLKTCSVMRQNDVAGSATSYRRRALARGTPIGTGDLARVGWVERSETHQRVEDKPSSVGAARNQPAAHIPLAVSPRRMGRAKPIVQGCTDGFRLSPLPILQPLIPRGWLITKYRSADLRGRARASDMAEKRTAEVRRRQRPKGLSGARVQPRAGAGPPVAEDGAPSSAARACLAVVGIGASAGGLEAFKQFFTAMPPDSGMGFVLIQHLDPAHQSLTAELLGKHTAMPVVERADRALPDPLPLRGGGARGGGK
jgi:Chemotaxis response regulator containing a CheY-like receiver domain and a methylesterase domain